MSQEDKIDKDGWSQWSLYIIKSIETLQNRMENLEEEVNAINIELQKEITKFNENSKFTSMIIGLIVSLVVSVVSGYFVYKITEEDVSKDVQQIYYQQQPPDKQKTQRK